MRISAPSPRPTPVVISDRPFTAHQEARLRIFVQDILISNRAFALEEPPSGYRLARSFLHFRGQPGTRTAGMRQDGYVIGPDVYLREKGHGYTRWYLIGAAPPDLAGRGESPWTKHVKAYFEEEMGSGRQDLSRWPIVPDALPPSASRLFHTPLGEQRMAEWHGAYRRDMQGRKVFAVLRSVADVGDDLHLFDETGKLIAAGAALEADAFEWSSR